MNARIIMLAAGVLLVIAPVVARAAVTAEAVARAQTAFQQVAAGKIDRSTLTPSLNSDLTSDTEAVLAQKATTLGTYSKFTAIGQTDVDGITTTIFRLTFPAGLLDFNFGIDDATNKIAKLYFVPGPSNDPTQ